MAKNRTKTLVFNTLLLVFCCVIIALYSLNFNKGDNGAKKALLRFDTEGGTAIAALEIGECQIVERPEDPTKEGYIFQGWTLNGEPFDFTQEVCGEAELKAVWVEEESPEVTYITFYLNKGDGSENVAMRVEQGTVPEQPEDPTRDGYDFVGWEKDGIPYNFNEPLNDNDVLVAKWNVQTEPEDPNAVYEVTFNLNGGTGTTPAKQSVKTGEKATIPTERPTRDKYDFVGWGTSKTGAANIGSTVIRKNTVFYAIWKSNVKTYTVTINLDGGKASRCTTKQTVEENGNPTGCTNPTKTNYGFAGWTDGTNEYDNLSQFVITKNTTIRAKWEQNQYTIVYNLGNGTSSSCKSSSPKGGSTYSFKTCAANTVNYTFNRLTGFRGSDGRTYNPGATVNLTSSNSSITLTAQYAEQQYAITCKEIYTTGPEGNSIATNQCSLSFSPTLNGGAIYINGAKSSGSWGSKNVGKGTWQICVNNGQQCTNNVTVNYSA